MRITHQFHLLKIVVQTFDKQIFLLDFLCIILFVDEAFFLLLIVLTKMLLGGRRVLKVISHWIDSREREREREGERGKGEEVDELKK